LAGIDWPAVGPVRLLNVDLSTVTASGDIVLGIGDPLQCLVHLEFQAGPDAQLGRRVLLNNVLLHYRFGVSVQSVVILLRPKADSPAVQGVVRYQARAERGGMDLAFEVVRLWQRPVEAFLAGGVALLPLAVLCQLPPDKSPEESLPEILRRIEERLTREATPADAAKLMRMTFVLAGMRVEKAELKQFFAGEGLMKESFAYDVLIEEGEVKALRKTLLRQGRIRFGDPTEETEAAIGALSDVERLERLTERLVTANSWQELLASR
jgi:hypothetical protein